MKDVILLFDTACMYEIVILSYFLKATGAELIYCSLKEKSIITTEGFTVNVDTLLSEIDADNVRSIIVPGGDVTRVKDEEVFQFLKDVRRKGKVVAGICAGVDVMEEAGILKDIESTHSADLDVVRDHHIITARANAYVDFAIEVGREFVLFEDEEDLQETIDFWKLHKRM